MIHANICQRFNSPVACKIMNSTFQTTVVFCAVLVLGFTGCSHRAENNSTEKAIGSANVSQTPPPITAQPAASTTPAAPGSEASVQEMNQAMALYKSGSYEDAVSRLQKLRAQTTMSPQQAMAVQDATAAVMNELYALAAKGDPRAQQAINQYQRLQGH
jgi:thiamine biosynthesis lipoprotein ApbE